MVQLYSIPTWFDGFNVAFEVLFLLATSIVAFYSFKIYKISSKKEVKLFGLAFASLSISYLIIAIVNIYFISAESGIMMLTIERMMDIKNIAVSSYIFFSIMGFVTLLYTTLKIERLRIYGLLVLLTFTAINFSFNKIFMIYFITSLFLLFINYHYFREYLDKKRVNILLVFLGMIFLFLSNVIFLVETAYISTYVVSHILELIGYTFIIASLIKIIKNGKKKK